MTWWPPRTLVPAGASLSQLFLIHFTLWWATSSFFIFHPEENGLSSFNKESVKDGRKQGLLGAFRVRSDSVSKKITHGVRCLVISDATIPFFKTCCCCRLFKTFHNLYWVIMADEKPVKIKPPPPFWRFYLYCFLREYVAVFNTLRNAVFPSVTTRSVLPVMGSIKTFFLEGKQNNLLRASIYLYILL